MPLVTLTIRKGLAPATIDGILDAVHSALVSVGVPPADRFHRVLQLESDALRADPTYPDLKHSRSEQFILIELTLAVGRSIKIKRQIAGSVVTAVKSLGLSGEDVMIVFNENSWESWSFGGGRFFYA